MAEHAYQHFRGTWHPGFRAETKMEKAGPCETSVTTYDTRFHEPNYKNSRLKRNGHCLSSRFGWKRKQNFSVSDSAPFARTKYAKHSAWPNTWSQYLSLRTKFHSITNKPMNIPSQWNICNKYLYSNEVSNCKCLQIKYVHILFILFSTNNYKIFSNSVSSLPHDNVKSVVPMTQPFLLQYETKEPSPVLHLVHVAYRNGTSPTDDSFTTPVFSTET